MTIWLPTLKTATPQDGFELAIKMARAAIKMTQPDAEVRDKLRPVYAENADALIASSQVAAANDYWRDAV